MPISPLKQRRGQTQQPSEPWILHPVLVLVIMLAIMALVQLWWSQYQEDIMDLSALLNSMTLQQARMEQIPRSSPEKLREMPIDVEQALDLLVEGFNDGERATFVQVGANDGIFGDPLYEPMKTRHGRWIGLLVEPQPELYTKLTVLHQDKRDWSFYNGLLASTCGTDGTIAFCETTSPGEGDWKTQGQISSLDMSSCKASKRKGDNKYHVVERPCESSFESLIQHHGKFIKPQEIDLLQIDVEGHDFELLKIVKYDTMLPRCIHYESRHLWGQRKAAKSFLADRGYTIRKVGMNTLACLVKEEDSSLK